MVSWQRIALFLTLPIVLYLLGAAGQVALESYYLRQNAEHLKAEIAELRARDAELRRQIDYLRSDAYVEKVAREELYLVKPGEKAAVVLVAPEAEPARKPTSAPSSSSQPDPRPTWQRWYEFFLAKPLLR